MNVKKSNYAGHFYPYNRDELIEILDELNNKADNIAINGKILTGISPHAGYVYSGLTAMHFYKSLKNEYERIVIIGPSHRSYFNGFALLEEEYWSTPLGEVEIDNEFNDILEDTVFFYDSTIHNTEHSVEVQIPFLQYILKDIKIVPIVMGQQNYKNINYFIEKIRLLEPKNTLFIASSDLYHGYDYEKGKSINKKTLEKIQNNDYEEFYNYFIGTEETEDAPACGGGPIAIILGINKVLGINQMKLLHNTTSSDVIQQYEGYTVGYASFTGVKSE